MSNPFINTLTLEQKKVFESRSQSKKEAEMFFLPLYGSRITSVIIANVMNGYSNRFHKSAQSFEEAWTELGYQTVAEIIFRAVNCLPCKEKDKGELSEFIKKATEKSVT